MIIKNFCDRLIDLTEINNCESNDIIEMLDMIKSKGYEDEVIYEIDMNCDQAKQLILSGVLCRQTINEVITSYNEKENNLVKSLAVCE